MAVTVVKKSPEESEESGSLSDLQRQGARLLVAGMPQVDIARALHVRPQSVSEWKAQVPFQRYAEQLRRESHDMFRESQGRLFALATAALTDLLLTANPDVRLKAVELVYRRAAVEQTNPSRDPRELGFALLATLREQRSRD